MLILLKKHNLLAKPQNLAELASCGENQSSLAFFSLLFFA